MFDILNRACRHPIDYSGVLRVTNLKFKERVHETGNIYSFIFTADKLPSWKAGEHAIFMLPTRSIEGKTWRPFSVASAPHEGVVRIGTIISDTPSSFKQNLYDLKPGENIRMFGPYGELYVRPGMKRVVGIAGGIGITPFRSILSDLAMRKSDVKLTLIYSAREGCFAFQTELESWKAANPNIEIIYTKTPDEVNAALKNQTTLHGNNAHYFLSGAPGMIEALRKSLSEQNIRRSHVINDPFKGY